MTPPLTPAVLGAVALEPCPFCGSDKITIGYAGQPAHSLFIVCTACHANGPAVPRHSDQCANLWNTRTHPSGGVREALEEIRILLKVTRSVDGVMETIDEMLADLQSPLSLPTQGGWHTPTSDSDVAEALTQACEYFENRADVNDGDYGVPEPNTEMRLAQMCKDALDRLPAPPVGVLDQKEDATRIDGSMQSDGAVSKSGGEG